MQSPPTQHFQAPSFAMSNQPTQAPLDPQLIQWKVGTNQGPRKDNQDTAIATAPGYPAIQNKGILLVLCDGVGGEEGGHIASLTAANEALLAFYSDARNDLGQSLVSAIEQANAAVQRESQAAPRFARMATTAVLAAVYNGVLWMAHVGDSRGYLFRNGQLSQLTRDHTFANAQVDSGTMTTEQAQRSIYRGTLVRSLGMQGDHTPDVKMEPLQPGDRVLLCSDGLHGVVNSEQITRILQSQPDAQQAVNQLISTALTNQTSDNVSVIVLNYGEMAKTAFAPAATGGRPAWMIPAMIVAAVIVLGAIGLGLSGVLGGGGNVPPTPTVAAVATSAPVAPTSVPAAVASPTSPPATTASAAPTTQAITSTSSAEATAVPNEVPPTVTETPTGVATSTLVPTPTNTPTPRPTRTPTRTPTPTDTPVPTPVPVQPTQAPSGGGDGGGGGGGSQPQPPATNAPPP
jgi:protein phosphatase